MQNQEFTKKMTISAIGSSFFRGLPVGRHWSTQLKSLSEILDSPLLMCTAGCYFRNGR